LYAAFQYNFSTCPFSLTILLMLKSWRQFWDTHTHTFPKQSQEWGLDRIKQGRWKTYLLCFSASVFNLQWVS
jgi:hypothetical protein